MIVAGDNTEPSSVTDPGLILGTTAEEQVEAAVDKEAKPVFATTAGATSILVSGADKSMYVIENGDIVADGKATIADPSKPLGENVFILQGGDGKAFTWQAIEFHRTDPNRRRWRRRLRRRAYQGAAQRHRCDQAEDEARHGAGDDRPAGNRGYPHRGQGLRRHDRGDELEQFQEKWMPLFHLQLRQTKELYSKVRFSPDRTLPQPGPVAARRFIDPKFLVSSATFRRR